MNKIEENGAAKEEISGCHKKMQNRTANKKWPKRPKTRFKRVQKLWKKRGKKGKKARAHQGCPKREKGMVKKVLTGQ